MRYAGVVMGGLLLSAVVFSSCTCHKEIEPPPTFEEHPSGFHANQPKITPQARVQAATPTAKVPLVPPQLAQTGPSPTPPASVPDDFPKDVPIFKDAAIAAVQDLANNAHNVVFSTTAPVADVFRFYQDKMTHGGWKVTQEFERPNHSFVSFQKGNMVANLTVAEDVTNPGKQVIAIMYEAQKPLDFDEF